MSILCDIHSERSEALVRSVLDQLVMLVYSLTMALTMGRFIIVRPAPLTMGRFIVVRPAPLTMLTMLTMLTRVTRPH